MRDDSEDREWAMVSRTGERLHDASVLLDTARGECDPTKASMFCGCACLVLVVALEEELSLVIRSATEEQRSETLLGSETTTRAGLPALRGATLSKRIIDVPKLLSNGRLRMRPSGSQVRALWELLRVRNVLAHKTPDTILDVSTEETPSWESQLLSVLKDDPWRRVTVSAVADYLEAVRLFVNEVQEIELDDEGVYEGGAITGPAPA